MRRWNFSICRALLLILPLLGVNESLCRAQKPEVADATCDGLDLEQAGYTVRGSTIVDPFDFLPWVKSRQRRAATRIAVLIDGKPFLYSNVRDAALKIIEEENFLPDTSEARVKIRLELVTLKNCSNKAVDVVYRIYSTQLRPVLSAAPEHRVEERRNPEETAGLANVNAPESRPVRLKPLAGYDSVQKLFGGARLELVQKHPSGLVNSGIIEGQGSSQMHAISGKMIGSNDDLGWVAHLEWSLDFNNFSLPTGTGDRKGGSLSASISGTSRPFGKGDFVFRFGGMIEGGNRQTSIVNPRLTSDTTANSSYGSVRLFTGIASRLRRHLWSASYGLQLGVAGRTVRVDWAKHIGDVQHEFWYPVADHKVLSLESRLTFGAIQVRGKIPVTERFFGGNREENFIASDSWQIRANPVIRAIPGNKFFRTASGDGGDRFLSYNLTASYSIWSLPLVPSELSRDKEFQSLLEGQLVNAESFVQLYFLTKDEHFLKLAEFIQQPEASPPVQTALASLSTAVTAAQASHPGQHETEFEGCTGAIRVAQSRAGSGAKAKGEQLYGFVVALLSDDEDLLNEVIEACGNVLNGSGLLNGDPAIAASVSRLNQIRVAMENEFSRIDQASAEKKAKEDLAFTRRTLKTLLNEVNIYSVGPAFIFDIARLNSKRMGLGGVRYGPGVGLRLELASSMNLTVGYAWNVKPGIDEGPGTMFFSLGVRDLFR